MGQESIKQEQQKQTKFSPKKQRWFFKKINILDNSLETLNKGVMSLPIRDMQIKTSLRFPFTLIRMAKISQQMPVHAGRMHGNRNTYPLMMGVQTGTNTMEISVMVTQKLKFDLPRDTAIQLWVYTQRIFHLPVGILVHVYSFLFHSK